MDKNNTQDFIKDVLENMPQDWLNLTTHRLDIYDESQAKSQFLEQFENLFVNNNANHELLKELPTAYDYIRLGHPLSCALEWVIAKQYDVEASHVISFSSKSIPVFAILRENLLLNKRTQIAYTGSLPEFLSNESLKTVYGYTFDLIQVASIDEIPAFDGSTILISETSNVCQFQSNSNVDFLINLDHALGSVILISEANESYVGRVQHVRRRETIAMTPANTLTALQAFVGQDITEKENNLQDDKTKVLATINKITGTTNTAVVASSGLSMQYAIMMGLIHEAMEEHKGKAIKIVVPPNCYGGTNDQARRVAAANPQVEIMDLLVDDGNDMVQSIDTVLETIAEADAVPYIIAEIPTNPRVEVPDLVQLKAVLSKERKTASGTTAIAPVFILDQTFCPNTPFLGEGAMLSSVKAIAYVSGSKFPSGGKCTAGYCVANTKAVSLLNKIAFHLDLCDNEATDLQYEILAAQMPSMVQRIAEAYKNTRDFVTFIQEQLPEAKINFVSEELAAQGFTPSVFSLDLPTKGNTEEERETYKRVLNLKLINLMINEIPNESKYCVSYGQLKGCYWTIPATSTQGTTKEGDKDYIARVAVSPDLDLNKHKQVFADFVASI